MPIFDYSCRTCGTLFEFLLLPGGTPQCPQCSGTELDKLVSAPAIKSDTTHALAMKAAKKRDTKQAGEQARAQREYELKHND
jgi:putative FmdB family regulatory protein